MRYIRLGVVLYEFRDEEFTGTSFVMKTQIYGIDFFILPTILKYFGCFVNPLKHADNFLKVILIGQLEIFMYHFITHSGYPTYILH
jgi:hypothetical protein